MLEKCLHLRFEESAQETKTVVKEKKNTRQRLRLCFISFIIILDLLKLIDHEFILTRNIITQLEISLGKTIESQIRNQQSLGPFRYPTHKEFPDTFPHYKMQIFK